MENETWKIISGWPYEVSNLGRVRRTTGGSNTWAGRILKELRIPRGYRSVRLYSTLKEQSWCNYTIHNLVLTAFVGLRPKGYQANHIDGDKTNNRLDNLEWVTQSQNKRHSFRIGLESNKGTLNPGAKLTDVIVLDCRRRYWNHTATARMLAREYGVGTSTMRDAINGKTWKHV